MINRVVEKLICHGEPVESILLIKNKPFDRLRVTVFTQSQSKNIMQLLYG